MNKFEATVPKKLTCDFSFGSLYVQSAEMGVEGDLTAVYSTEYITTGNTDGERGRKVILRRDTVQGT